MRFTDFLSTSVDSAFEYARNVSASASRPNAAFCDALEQMLLHRVESPLKDGTPEWAHVVAGLVMARDLDPNRFAAAAAVHLESKDGAVWTAALRLLNDITCISAATLEAIVSSLRASELAAKDPGRADELVLELRRRVSIGR